MLVFPPPTQRHLFVVEGNKTSLKLADIKDKDCLVFSTPAGTIKVCFGVN